MQEYADLSEAASDQAVAVTTIGALQTFFDGRLGAFAYLLFILLYMPCVATIGVIFKEIGGFWAIFSTTWSLTLAYTCAVLCYQLGGLMTNRSVAAGPALGWSALVIALSVGCFALARLFRTASNTAAHSCPAAGLERQSVSPPAILPIEI